MQLTIPISLLFICTLLPFSLSAPIAADDDVAVEVTALTDSLGLINFPTTASYKTICPNGDDLYYLSPYGCYWHISCATSYTLAAGTTSLHSYTTNTIQDCILLCSSWNSVGQATTCTTVTYRPRSVRSGNCVIYAAGGTKTAGPASYQYVERGLCPDPGNNAVSPNAKAAV